VGNTPFCPSDSSEEEDCFATFAKSPFWQFGYLAISSELNIFCSSFIEFESRKFESALKTPFFQIAEKRSFAEKM
jgi:hypothetical protein